MAPTYYKRKIILLNALIHYVLKKYQLIINKDNLSIQDLQNYTNLRKQDFTKL